MRLATFSCQLKLSPTSDSTYPITVSGEWWYMGDYSHLKSTKSQWSDTDEYVGVNPGRHNPGNRIGLFNLRADLSGDTGYYIRLERATLGGDSGSGYLGGTFHAVECHLDSSMPYDTMDDYVDYIDYEAKSTSITQNIGLRFQVRRDDRTSWEYAFTNYMAITIPGLNESNCAKVVYVSDGANAGTVPGGPRFSATSIRLMERLMPERTNYVFRHWGTSEGGDGAKYYPGATLYYSNAHNGGTFYLYPAWDAIITFDMNGGTHVHGVPWQLYKSRNVALDIPSETPTHTKKVFTSWNTSQYGDGDTYYAGGTIPASMNTAVTLYAQWRDPTPAPTISSLRVTRCDASGREDDFGTYAKVTVVWSVNRTYDSSNTGTLRVTINGSAIAFDSGTSGQSGTAIAIVSNISADQQYTVSATVSDTNRDTHHVPSTTRNAILTRAKFIMDFRAGGNAMGIGSAAPQSGLMVGYKTTFNDEVTINGNVTCVPDSTWTAPSTSYQNNNSSHVISEVFEAADGITVDRVSFYACGPMRGVYINAYGSIEANRWTGIGNILTNNLTSNYIPRYMPASFVWENGVGRISTSGYVSVYAFSASSAALVTARYF